MEKILEDPDKNFFKIFLSAFISQELSKMSHAINGPLKKNVLPRLRRQYNGKRYLACRAHFLESCCRNFRLFAPSGGMYPLCINVGQESTESQSQ